jgi:hypothetical protein
VPIGKPLTNVRGSEIPILSRDREGVGCAVCFVTDPNARGSEIPALSRDREGVVHPVYLPNLVLREIPVLSRDREGVGWECYFVTLPKFGLSKRGA